MASWVTVDTTNFYQMVFNGTGILVLSTYIRGSRTEPITFIVMLAGEPTL